MAPVERGSQFEWDSLIESLENNRFLAVELNRQSGAEWHKYMMAHVRDIISVTLPATKDSHQVPPWSNGKRKRPRVEVEDTVNQLPKTVDKHLQTDAAKETVEASSAPTPTLRVETRGGVGLQVRSTIGAAKVTTTGTVTFEPVLEPECYDLDPDGSVNFHIDIPQAGTASVRTDAAATFMLFFNSLANVYIMDDIKLKNFELQGHATFVSAGEGPKTLVANAGAFLHFSTEGAATVEVITGASLEEEKQKEVATPMKQEIELTPEEKHTRKQREVLYLRHNLQKGLLAKDQEPNPEHMKAMSEFLTKLEGFPDLEVSIIKATKINKVLKFILRLENIPKEEEFQFKPRSQALLDKWNELLIAEAASTPAQEPNPEHMKAMSEFLTRLEGFPDLEVSIIKATKINEVLKAILKLENIPKEEEFKCQFKPRSQALLDKWNELLIAEAASTAAPATVKKTTSEGVEEKGDEPSASSKTEEVAKEKDGDSKLAEI